MRLQWLVTGAAALAIGAGFLARPAAQGSLTGGGSGNDVIGGMPTARALTPFEEFTGKLKLNQKTQIPAVEEIFTAAAKDAAPVGVELLQLRQKMLNVALSGTPEEMKAAGEAYAASAAKMAAIEASTFAKVYALLDPKQQSNAPQAFALLAGFFQSQASGRGGRGGRQ